MVVANTDYNNTLLKIEQIKCLIVELQQDFYAQIPQGITDMFDVSKSELFNNLEEIETTLIEFINNKNG